MSRAQYSRDIDHSPKRVVLHPGSARGGGARALVAVHPEVAPGGDRYLGEGRGAPFGTPKSEGNASKRLKHCSASRAWSDWATLGTHLSPRSLVRCPVLVGKLRKSGVASGQKMHIVCESSIFQTLRNPVCSRAARPGPCLRIRKSRPRRSTRRKRCAAGGGKVVRSTCQLLCVLHSQAGLLQGSPAPVIDRSPHRVMLCVCLGVSTVACLSRAFSRHRSPETDEEVPPAPR